MTNRLAGAISPYLAQHADNPVDWWPWCDQAFAEARHRDVPIMLSVGYAACHWCHVMAHESFADPVTAAQLNRDFVSIKVDREERPDIDAVYMQATQALSGHGGWPMTAFLDHEGRPFYAGTYFPADSGHGIAPFRHVLAQLCEVWRTDRAAVRRAADQVHQVLRGATAVTPTSADEPPVTAADVSAAVRSLAADFDPVHGGFGGAPKFPPAMVMEFLLRADALLGEELGGTRMVHRTLSAMAGGGIHDQLAGGFARYSVDATWTVPHFEKMLYDNALLLRAYLHWWRATGDPTARRVALTTAAFIVDGLGTAQGAFASSLDADSEGREGAHYVWTRQQLIDVLGRHDGSWVAQLCGVTPTGSFESGSSVLTMRTPPVDPQRWEGCRSRLLAARSARPAPARDGKVVTAWNGLAIAALAEAGALLDQPHLTSAATRCADFLLATHRDTGSGRLTRVSRDGTPNPAAPGVLEDYADLAEGLLELYQVSGELRWLRGAGELIEVVLAEFAEGPGILFDTPRDGEPLVLRPRDTSDGVAPSGTSAAAAALLTHGALTGSLRHREAAGHLLRGLLPQARSVPRYSGWAWSALVAWLAGPVEVAVVRPAGSSPLGFDPLHRVALMSTSPGLVTAAGHDGDTEPALLAGRPAQGGTTTAYPCRDFTCQLPVTDADQLAASITAMG